MLFFFLREHARLHSALQGAQPARGDIMWGHEKFSALRFLNPFGGSIFTQLKFLFWGRPGGKASIYGTTTSNFLSCFYLPVLKLFPSTQKDLWSFLYVERKLTSYLFSFQTVFMDKLCVYFFQKGLSSWCSKARFLKSNKTKQNKTKHFLSKYLDLQYCRLSYE